MLGLGSLLAEDTNLLERSVLTEQELNGALAEAAELDPASSAAQQITARINRGAKQGAVIPTRDLTDRAQYSLRAHMLPANIREALAVGRIKPVNMAFYKIVRLNGKQQFEIMENADTKKAGFTNINNRKLEENNFFLLTSVVLQVSGQNCIFDSLKHALNDETQRESQVSKYYTLQKGFSFSVNSFFEVL